MKMSEDTVPIYYMNLWQITVNVMQLKFYLVATYLDQKPLLCISKWEINI